MYRIIFIMLAGMAFFIEVKAQEKNDLPASEQIMFSPSEASEYIENMLSHKYLWKPESDSLKLSLSRLIEHYNESYDSIANKLSQVNYHSVSFKRVNSFENDTLDIRWLNDTTFIIDTVILGKAPLYVQKTKVQKIIDSLVFIDDSILAAGYLGDSIIRIRDTVYNESDIVTEVIIDTAFIESKKLQLFQIKGSHIVPEIIPSGSRKSYRFIANGAKIIISEPVRLIVADKNSPFNIVPNEKVPDSIGIAVQTLLSYTNKRDSIPVFLNNIEGVSTPFWLTSNENDLQRYWVKNEKNDSVSVWMGNTDKENITLVLEDDINVERIEKETVDNVPFTMVTPLMSLAEIQPFEEIPVYWDFDFSSSFSLSQNYLSNWSKGGESSFSTLLDIKGQAKYSNKEAKTEWTGNGRLKYGSIYINEKDELRTNTDILEVDSKYNKGLRKKTDFSALFHMKSQIAEGFSYPDEGDNILVSKFLNPASFTIGAGLEYKPVKKSTINFSVLSYKNTFVLDTANIDQTKHGIEADKKAKQEMGGQLLIKNELILLEDLKINNSMRLFSNYLENPGNVDIEWELDLEKQISLYFTVLLNMHLIYDDDIRFTKFINDEPVLLADGSEKKIPKLQFKQFLGLTFLIKL